MFPGLQRNNILCQRCSDQFEHSLCTMYIILIKLFFIMYNYDDNEPIMLLIFFSYASKMSKIHVLNFPYTQVATYEL